MPAIVSLGRGSVITNPTVSFWIFAFVLLVSVALTLVFTPLSIRLGRRFNLVDLPGGRRKHKGVIPRTGGLGLYPAFVVSALFPVILGIPRSDPLELTRLIGVLLGMAIVWITGLLDDRFQLGFVAQFIGLVLAALAAIAFKVVIEVFNNPFTDQAVWLPWYLMMPVTLTWLVTMTGTMNMLDGLDGLATGVTAIAALILFAHMVRLGQHTVALLPLALLGCCLGFLCYNFYPAKIFLGGGAYVLGYGLGALSIVAGAKVASALLVMWLPLVDVIWQGYSRWRRGQPLSLGDRGHLHLRLQDMGWPTRRIVLLYYSITALLGAIALLGSSRQLKFAILVIAGLIILIALILITRRSGHWTITGR